MAGPLKNARHERYALGLAKGLSADAAYQEAGFKASRGNAIRLKANENVKARVLELQSRVAQKTVVDAAWLLDRLAEEVEADLADLYDDNENLKPIAEWPSIWRKGLVAGVEVEELFDGFGKDRIHIGELKKLKLSDRIKRLELIGKHVSVQAFRDQIAVSGEIAIVVAQADADL